jgi:hypothetical protein
VGRGDAGLEYGTLEVAGVRRGYWLARGPDGPSGTLLMVLHGSGASGKDVATIFTRLATPGAGGRGDHGVPGRVARSVAHRAAAVRRAGLG